MKTILTIKGKFEIFSKKGNKIGVFGIKNEVGTYFINGTLKNAEILPRNSEKIAILNIPKPEKKYLIDDLPYLLFVDNTKNHKASTIAQKNKFFINTDFFKGLNFYEKTFVIGHELGHKFFFNENYCDLFGLHFCVKNFVDPRFINFEKILFDKERINFIKKSFKILK